MFREAGEAPERVRCQFAQDAQALRRLAGGLQRLQPRAVITCARGSSDHAATYARYLVETRLGLLSASSAPSVASVYGVRQDMSRCLFLAISQSGHSPDLLAAAAAARDAGAFVLALVNDEDSPLARGAHECLAMRAGREESVAATKSYVCSLAALAHLVARWAEDAPLLAALERAPEALAQAWELDWSALVDALAPLQHLFVLGRGLGLGLAQEAALKLKETCALHAGAYSTAEVQHGPMALLAKQDVAALMFSQDDEARAGIESLARELSANGVRVWFAGAPVQGAPTLCVLPALPAHPAIAPMLLAQSFYRAAATLSIARGLDPDHPPRLSKVTRTV
jgi:glucosamine--fructose-6-phosphate aminotransferase (isomerizing)